MRFGDSPTNLFATLTLNPNPKPALCQLAWQSMLTLHDAVASTTPCQSYRLATSTAMRFGNSPTNLLATLTLNPNPKPALCQLAWQSMLTLHDAVASTTPCQSYRLATSTAMRFGNSPTNLLATPTLNPNPKPAPLPAGVAKHADAARCCRVDNTMSKL